MATTNELRRLVKNIRSGRFNRKHYRERRKYYGLELKVDTFYVDGGFGMSVYANGEYVTWVYYCPTKGWLNFGGEPADEVIDRIESNN